MSHGVRTPFPRRRDILDLLQDGLSYDEIADRLGIHPGLAHLVATGLPADGSDAPSGDSKQRPGMLPSSQHLSNAAEVTSATSSTVVAEWIKRRVSADGQMQRAAADRTPAPGPRAAGEETPDLADVLTRDHMQVTALLKQLATIPGAKKGGSPSRVAARKAIVSLATRDLQAHVAAEKQHLWPAVREALKGGDALAEKGQGMAEHGEEVLSRLSELDGTEDEFDDLVEELSASARQHVAFQDSVFLRLRDAVPHQELVTLGGLAASARDAAEARGQEAGG